MLKVRKIKAKYLCRMDNGNAELGIRNWGAVIGNEQGSKPFDMISPGTAELHCVKHSFTCPHGQTSLCISAGSY